MRGTRSWTWWGGTKIWLLRFAPQYLALEGGRREPGTGEAIRAGGCFDHSVKAAKSLLRERLHRNLSSEREATTTESLYRVYRFEKSRTQWKRLALSHVELSRGFTLFSRARLRSLWTSRQMSYAGLLGGRYRHECPLCGQSGEHDMGETLTHILTSCEAWEDERQSEAGTTIRRLLAVMYVTARDRGEGQSVPLLNLENHPVLGQGTLEQVMQELDVSEAVLTGLVACLNDELKRTLRGILLGGEIRGSDVRWRHWLPPDRRASVTDGFILDVVRFLQAVFEKRPARLSELIQRQERRHI